MNNKYKVPKIGEIFYSIDNDRLISYRVGAIQQLVVSSYFLTLEDGVSDHKVRVKLKEDHVISDDNNFYSWDKLTVLNYGLSKIRDIIHSSKNDLQKLDKIEQSIVSQIQNINE